jgi:hypothetical protein
MLPLRSYGGSLALAQGYSVHVFIAALEERPQSGFCEI